MKSSRVSSCMLLWIVLLYCFGTDCAFKTIVLAQNVPVISSCPSLPQNATSGWTYIGTKGGIETYLKKVEGSDLLATRGVAYLDMHISQAMGPYIDLTLARDWVHMLKHIKQYPIENGTDLNPDADEDMIYQVLELPWPVAPRDVVLHRQFNWDPVAHAVTINYHSIEDDRCPRTPGTVRADSPHSMWRFRSVPSCNYMADQTPPGLVASDSIPVAETNVSSVERFLGAIKRRLGKPLKVGTFELSVLFARRGLVNRKEQECNPQKVKLGSQGGVTPVYAPKAPIGARRNAIAAQSAPSTKPQLPALKAAKLDLKPHQHHLAALACSSTRTQPAENSRGGPQDGGPTRWRGVGTVIEFESFVDSHGSVPTWLINHLQRSFPAQALSAYRALAEKKIAEPYQKVIDW